MMKIPPEAVDPVVDRYIKFHMGSTALESLDGRPPLLQAMTDKSDTELFMILLHAKRNCLLSNGNDCHSEEQREKKLKDSRDFFAVVDEDGSNLWHFGIEVLPKLDFLVDAVPNWRSLFPDINSLRDDGLAPLHVAATHGITKAVGRLVQQFGADKNIAARPATTYYNNWTPLCFAIVNHNVATTQLLIQLGCANPELNIGYGFNLFHLAGICPPKRSTGLKITQVVIDMVRVYQNGRLLNQYLNHRDHVHDTPLLRASREGLRGGVKSLVKAGADAQLFDVRNGYTPLMYAVTMRRLDIVKVLLQDERGKLTVNIPDNSFGTPLLHALGQTKDTEFIEIARLLLDAGANGWTDEDGERYTPIEVAILQQNTFGIEMALSHFIARGGRNSNPNQAHRTVLHTAAGETVVTPSLFERLVNAYGMEALNVKDKNGQTPLEIAQTKNNVRIVETINQMKAQRRMEGAQRKKRPRKARYRSNGKKSKS